MRRHTYIGYLFAFDEKNGEIFTRGYSDEDHTTVDVSDAGCCFVGKDQPFQATLTALNSTIGMRIFSAKPSMPRSAIHP